jgi:hypothetical protein
VITGTHGSVILFALSLAFLLFRLWTDSRRRRCPACGRLVPAGMLETVQHGRSPGDGATTACRYCLYREQE